jgi:SAM-dependent methyltransferase
MAQELRRDRPMIASDSVDAVVSNCVLNLVENGHKERLFGEIFRVLKKGGRAVISDIVSDEPVPQDMQQDPELWSGCISGALTESGFLEAFEAAGFHGLRILERQVEPWQTIEGIEFRSLTLEAFKGKQGPCLERNQAVIYRGPFKSVVDDDGHELQRGRRYAVCDKTFKIYQSEPYAGSFEAIEPRQSIALEDAAPFACTGNRERDPRETKGEDYHDTTEPIGACGPGDCC